MALYLGSDRINEQAMKLIRMTAIAAVSAMMMLNACGNADAKNEKKNKANVTKAVTELTAEDFKTKVYDLTVDELIYLGDKPAIVDFTATWCGPCQRIAPVLEEIATEYKGKIVVYKVDIDKERGLAESFNVSSIPAILYIPSNGEEPVMTIGARNKEKFKKEIDTILLK